MNANLSSGEAVRTYFGHEVTHILESGKSYKAMSDFIRNSEVGKNWVKEKGYSGFEEFAEAKLKTYNEQAERTGNENYRLNEEQAMQEVIADWCGENLMGNSAISEQAIQELCRESRSTAEKIRDFLKRLVTHFTGSEEEKQLRKALDLFEKALQESKENGETSSVIAEI